MSAALISRSPDLQRLVDEGFELEIREGFLLVHNVPYVTTEQRLARGTLVCVLPLDPTDDLKLPLTSLASIGVQPDLFSPEGIERSH